jgi:hypothetical protein
MGTRKARQPAQKRPVYVNGIYCPTLTAGAKYASEILLREVQVYEIQRAANGELKIDGVYVTEVPPVMRIPDNAQEQEQRSAGAPLIRYPFKGKPLDIGITRVWS